MAFFLPYLWATSALLIHPILAKLPPDMSLFLLLNTDLDGSKVLSFDSEANRLNKGIIMRNSSHGLQYSDFWYLDGAYLGSWGYTSTNFSQDNGNPLVGTYGADKIVIAHALDNAARYVGPAAWLFLQQDDGTFMINTYDKRFLGLDEGNMSMPKLYPQKAGTGGHRFWEIIPVPTVEGDIVSWSTVTKTVAAPTKFLAGEGQVTEMVTVTETITQKSTAINTPTKTRSWTHPWALQTITLLASTGHSITCTETIEITPSTTLTVSGSASPATINQTITLTEVVGLDAGGKMVTLASVQSGTLFMPDKVVEITSTEWIDDGPFTEVVTVVVPETTVTPARSETVSSKTGAATMGGKKVSGTGRMDREVDGFVVRLLVFCFTLGGVGGAF
ncbi:hypothetical protein E2P81_ATG09016 [Venturia nashicola]|nr:hypothetical protein E2P81_ATG09016 [Venturia nashicola]